MRYADLKQERDEAIARAVEAERLSMKSEVDRIRAEHETEKADLLAVIDALLPVVEAADEACEAQEAGLKQRAWETWVALDNAVEVYREVSHGSRAPVPSPAVSLMRPLAEQERESRA
jgi:hypothetical protein